MGIVFDISHYMLEDGPGIRTNVFLKGCYLRCKWCSNAYGLEKKIQLSYDASKCVGCGRCLKVCEVSAIALDSEHHAAVQDFGKCINCLKCAAVCPAKARNQIGRELSADEVVKEVLKDRMYYRRGDGGVTLSGGEILMQADFAAEILQKCQAEGINTAIETSGCGRWNDLEKILSYCDSAFMDCKCMDTQKHRELTGVDNRVILENIRKAADYCKRQGIRLIVRLPLIPGLNDSQDNLIATAEFAKSLHGEPLLNILPYHNFGAAKYQFLGKTYETENLPLQQKEELDVVRQILNETNVRYSIGGYDI